MRVPVKNEWLAELLQPKRDLITEYWIEDIRAEGILGYQSITDEQLLAELPPTVDSMITAFKTGDEEGPRQHSIGVIQRRLKDGLLLPDLQMSLHALETAVMRIVTESDLGIAKEFEALQSASNMYYIVALIAAAVYEQLRVEQQRRFTTAYEFGIALSRTLDLNAVMDIAVRDVAEYLNAGAAALLVSTSEDERGEVQASYKLDSEVEKNIADICKSLDCGAADTAGLCTNGIVCAVSDVRASDQLDRWAGLLVAHEYLSMVFLPLTAKQTRLGTMVVLWHEVHSASGSEIDFLSALASHTANALQNAILYEEAQGKRELGMLLEASRLFSSSLDTQDILSKMARMATETVRADLAMVFIENSLQEGRNYVAHYAANRKAELAAERVAEYLSPGGEEDGVGILGENFSKGEPMLFGSAAEFPKRLRPLIGTIGSGLIVPLRQKGVLLGAFALLSLGKHAFRENDVSLATGLADLAVVAIENARLYEHERNIAQTLQTSFLPSTLPSIRGYETAAYYRPALVEAEVGGDFYDAFVSDNGNINIIIGDVSGKGLQAAVSTAMGKYMVRAYAAENPSPGNVLSRFNRIFYKNVPEYSFMTAFYVTLDPTNNTIVYASAGHDPPLLYSLETGQIEEITTYGICLGINAGTEYEEYKVQLQPGDVLLLYTDGATDVKGDTGRLDVSGLQELFLSHVDETAEKIVHGVSDGIWQYSNGRLTDDVALVVLKRQADTELS